MQELEAEIVDRGCLSVPADLELPDEVTPDDLARLCANPSKSHLFDAAVVDVVIPYGQTPMIQSVLRDRQSCAASAALR